MIEYIDEIKKISKKLLQEGAVDMVIGFKKGTMPLMNIPFAAKSESDINEFVWDSNCGINLANYLTDRSEKIGIVAKGCDSRSIVTHLTENIIKREQLVIIGVPCKGMIDRYKISLLFGADISEVVETGQGQIVVKGNTSEKSFDRDEVLQENCKVCHHPNPILFDEQVAGPVDLPKDANSFWEVEKVEALPDAERWNYFQDLISTCIRCYACRNACPACYCQTCFVDESTPQWLGKTDDPIDTMTFHILRAFHMAGRCTDCGACVRACPMGINVRAFTKKLDKDCLELWEWETGMDQKKKPVLETYQPDDPEDFIK